ncbi:SRPBCC family protein [Brachybacterium saurashtrense]|uniref:Polyketide cyclase n=1 Tax=Brachybacterium saurashtrense TaxID=556288 RepID=A0A345YQV2_9MICO|nr:SRPBCC family protein [Brachybacterium saurashtrense]AXK46304.1 polyketide cyclase [Brachybacterium saurashtrense]RRR24044.1 polyketide cyclase [Brachybacterium saurashtrense]
MTAADRPATADRLTTAVIEADPDLPLIRITRDFRASAAQLVRAHTDPEIYARWVGPKSLDTRIDRWDARTGGSWAFTNIDRATKEEYSFHGSFHEVREDRLVQTFTFDGWPDGVSLDTMTFEDLGDGWTRMHSQSLLDSFEARAGMLESGMEVGVNEGYEKLDALLEGGDVEVREG